MQNLFNIKGKPADSERILHNSEGRARFWCFLRKTGPKGGDPMAPVFRKNPSKSGPSNPYQSSGTRSSAILTFVILCRLEFDCYHEWGHEMADATSLKSRLKKVTAEASKAPAISWQGI